MSSDNSDKTNLAFWAGNQFNVDFNGHVNATSIDIGGDNKNHQDVHITKGTIYSGKHKPFNSTEDGFFLNYAGLSIGADFRVTSSGYLTAKQGTFGNATKNFTIGIFEDKDGITYTSLKGNNVYLGTDKISLGSNFSVDNTGNLTASSGKIASWYFTDGAFYNQTAKDAADKDNEVGYGKWNDKTKKYDSIYEKGMYFGNGGIRFGANFHVGSNGNMFAIAGTIGGWSIGSSSLTGGSLKLNSDGSLSGPGWSIASNGEATFSNVKSANIKGGTISGGSRTGGSIDPSKVKAPYGSGPSGSGFNGGTLNQWCKNIVTTSITADYITSKLN